MYLPDDIPSNRFLLILQNIDCVIPLLPVCSVEVIHTAGIEQPEQRLTPTDLLVKDIPQNALSNPSAVSELNNLRRLSGVKMINEGGVEELKEGDCGCLLCREYVTSNAF